MLYHCKDEKQDKLIQRKKGNIDKSVFLTNHVMSIDIYFALIN